MNEEEKSPTIWTPIRLTDKKTGRSVHISIFERALYLSGIFTFEDFWEITHPEKSSEESSENPEEIN